MLHGANLLESLQRVEPSSIYCNDWENVFHDKSDNNEIC